jgi:uncharacterized protein
MRLVLALGLVAILFAVAGAVQDPQIARYRVAIAGLERPLRIVQLSDSHVSPIDMPAERLRRVVAMMNAQRPDLVVLTGDYISGDPAAWSLAQVRAALAPFAALRAPLGVYAVLGNHDGSAATRAALAGTGVKLLVAERTTAGPITLVGADDLLRGSPAVEAMRRAVRGAPTGPPVVVLAHEPDFFQYLPPQAAMLIAGHTHGGQVMLPVVGTLSFGAFIDAHRRGLFFEHGQALLVSSGLGTSLLPIRIGVPPEIVVIELVSG